MQHPIIKTPLLETLADLEIHLETPVVPGEMEEWTEVLKSTLNRVESTLTQTIEKDHATQTAQIAGEDGELLRRVKQLREEDQQSRDKLKDVRSQLDRLSNRTEKVGPDEASLEQRMDTLFQSGIDFVIHTRRQEIAFDIWMLESFYRDRGVAD